MNDIPHTPVRVFLTGACAGLAEARDALGASPDVDVVGTASEPARAGSKLASSGAQVVLHAVQRANSIPGMEIATIRQHTEAPIVLLTGQLSSTIADEILRHGISDVAILPQPVEALAFTIRKARALGATGIASGADGQRERATGRSRTITLFSPKGGVGKTIIAANMATEFAKRLKRRTLLIDVDLQFGDSAIVLGLDPASTLLDLVMSHGDLDADKLAGFVCHHETGLDVLPAPLRPEDCELVTDERFASVLASARQAYDVIIIDTPSSFSGGVLTAFDNSDELLMVCSLDVPSVKDTSVALQTLSMLKFPEERCHIVLNRAGTRVGLNRREVEHVLGRHIDFEIPSNRLVPTSVNRGVPAVAIDPRADVCRAVHEMCLTLTPEMKKLANERDVKLSRADRRKLKRMARANERQMRRSSDAPETADEPSFAPFDHADNDHTTRAA